MRRKRAIDPTETQISQAVLGYLITDPRVGFAWRANSGGAKYVNHEGKAQYVAYGTPGQSDILGWMADGRILAVEIKRPGTWPDEAKFEDWGQLLKVSRLQERLIAQRGFLRAIQRAGGVGFVATSASHAKDAIDAACREVVECG